VGTPKNIPISFRRSNSKIQQKGSSMNAVVQSSYPNGVTAKQIAKCITPKIQELILLPTEKCNFRCTYCYEDFELGKMPEWVQKGIENLISARADQLKLLRFSWFGGEPLLAKGVMLRIADFACRLGKEKGFNVEGGTTTNGYLLDLELARQLITLKQDFFQITLDGWREAHDVTRRRADGRGTFDRIWKNLLALKTLDLKFEVQLRVHVRHDNLDSLKTLCREIALEFGNDPRFYVDFQDVRDMGGQGSSNVVVIPQSEFGRIKHQLGALMAQTLGQEVEPEQPEVRQVGESASSRRASERNLAEPYVCYAAKPNSLLIRSNGRVGKCTVALDDSRNDIGSLGEDGSVTIDNELLRGWVRGLGSLDIDELGCPVRGLPAATQVIKLHKGVVRSTQAL
jgi:uncharacterized protein